ncbi:MAG TPA: hypothetical protein VF173_20440 [Thermoanaerobaculia bacterium]|nr:hypothetical protein [Thermoanaerobaculia bacterium]
MRSLGAVLLLLLVVLSAAPAARAAEMRDVLGVAHAAGKYNFSTEDFLNEGADQILELGSHVIKVFVYPGHMSELYRFNSDWSPETGDVVDLVQRPYFQQLFAKPFSTIILEIAPATISPQFNDGLTPEEAAAERDQMYRLAKYLLTAYADSGKTFVLQNWEGDHLLRDGLADGTDPDPVRVQGMIGWWNARQDGVQAAREELRARNVEVAHACEVNFLAAAMQGKVTATNSVVPFTHCDLYSYSSWDIDFDPDTLVRALDYLESKAPPSRRFGRHNIYLGEYGMAKDQGTPEKVRFEIVRNLMEAALGWGVRYAVYWEVYCNEPAQAHIFGRPKNAQMRGFWLVRPDGIHAPMWNVLAGQLPAAIHLGEFSGATNQYLTVNPDDRTVAAGHWLRGSPWSVFTMKDWDGGTLESGHAVTLQTHDGLYLSVEPGVGGHVYARAVTAGRAERLILHKVGGSGPIRAGDSIVFETRDHLFLAPEVDAKGLLRALRSAPGPAEAFRFVEQDE